ncbi:hypothetical protein CPter91_5208 [Collimonas pratensis]|uniref:Uncharacterized protein n=1 Tax=Collimonas pratensis TaxID=279113 RepID=A0A127QBX6_9BURK|nr:hypothetical protein CPter91_5208 [Collimonas pratensis]
MQRAVRYSTHVPKFRYKTTVLPQPASVNDAAAGKKKNDSPIPTIKTTKVEPNKPGANSIPITGANTASLIRSI